WTGGGWRKRRQRRAGEFADATGGVGHAGKVALKNRLLRVSLVREAFNGGTDLRGGIAEALLELRQVRQAALNSWRVEMFIAVPHHLARRPGHEFQNRPQWVVSLFPNIFEQDYAEADDEGDVTVQVVPVAGNAQR